MILITGANGQLGQEICQLLTELGISYKGYNSTALDITNADNVKAIFEEISPSTVFHCAAYTAVDKAEDDRNRCYEVNVDGTRNIAIASEACHATMVYISTDYVFDGTKVLGQEWSIQDDATPQSVYGITKRKGELIVEGMMSHYYIIRTSWLYGEFGNNFVFTMKRLAASRPELSVVNDQFGRPTWTRRLAMFMWHLVSERQKYGYYHLSNDSQDPISWYDFACQILKDTDVVLKPIPSEEFPTKAKRPYNSTLDLSKSKATRFEIPMWDEDLRRFIEKLEKGDKTCQER